MSWIGFMDTLRMHKFLTAHKQAAAACASPPCWRKREGRKRGREGGGRKDESTCQYLCSRLVGTGTINQAHARTHARTRARAHTHTSLCLQHFILHISLLTRETAGLGATLCCCSQATDASVCETLKQCAFAWEGGGAAEQNERLLTDCEW